MGTKCKLTTFGLWTRRTTLLLPLKPSVQGVLGSTGRRRRGRLARARRIYDNQLAMVEDLPTNGQWRRLHEAAVGVKELSPWEWMTEADVFGVQDPETGELGFVSVMGLLGEHYAMSLYLGAEGLYAFWNLQNLGPSVGPSSASEALLEIPQLQVSFEDRNELDARDRKVIKELGFKFRGRKEWPMFRSYRPGFFPWFLEAEEARFLTEALNQLLELAPRFREDRSLLASDGGSYLVRVAHQEGGMHVWEDQVMEVAPPEPVPIRIEMDPQALETLARLPQSGHELEMDLFMFPTPIQGKKGSRPVFPYMLLTVDAGSGMVLGTELLEPTPSLEAMWGSVPLAVARQLAGLELRPKEVTVGTALLFQLLQPLAESARFELKRSHFLPALHEAKEALFEAFDG